MCSTSLCLDGGTRASLLAQARKGDRESLAKLILPYAPGLYLGALRLTRNPADAEDVRQDAFLKIDRGGPSPSRKHPRAQLPRPRGCGSARAPPKTRPVGKGGAAWPENPNCAL